MDDHAGTDQDSMIVVENPNIISELVDCDVNDQDAVGNENITNNMSMTHSNQLRIIDDENPTTLSYPTTSADASRIMAIDFGAIKLPSKNVRMGRPRNEATTVI